MFLAYAFLALCSLFSLSSAAVYILEDEYIGRSFLTGFNWENIADPTHGRVNYIDLQTALKLNLTYYTRSSFVMRADSTSVLDPKGPGRNSIRISSKKAYTTHVEVFNIRHMPQGCATWPAAWTLGPDWPNGGEIDILEGVNDVSPNQSTLHTSPNCTMAANRGPMTGSVAGTDCNALVDFNQGCGVKMSTTYSYGPDFNSIGGGWYAMERTNKFIRVWFWPRTARVPYDIYYQTGFVDTSAWGMPAAYFPSSSTCNLPSKMAAHNIIINLTLCGDWAGNVFTSSGCPGDCVPYVNNYPSAFKKAYWDIASLRTYQYLA